MSEDRKTSENYIEVTIQIEKELFEAISRIIKLRSSQNALSKIVNRALKEYIEKHYSMKQTKSKMTLNKKIIMKYIEEKVRSENGPVKMESIIEEIELEYGVQKTEAIEIVEKMLREGLLYKPKPGYIMPTY